MHFAPYDQMYGGKNVCLVIFLTLANCFVLVHENILELLGVICIPLKIKMCLVVPCTSIKNHCPTFIWKAQPLHGRCLVIGVKKNHKEKNV
jgi:hypothetical protein